VAAGVLKLPMNYLDRFRSTVTQNVPADRATGGGKHRFSGDDRASEQAGQVPAHASQNIQKHLAPIDVSVQMHLLVKTDMFISTSD
jgi:hypothetical protein